MSERNKDGLRITNQFRSKNGLVYDFKCEGTRLTISITPRQASTDGGDWHVDARPSPAPEGAPSGAWGSTRVDALSEVGRLWGLEVRSRGFPPVDWDAVREALSAVRA